VGDRTAEGGQAKLEKGAEDLAWATGPRLLIAFIFGHRLNRDPLGILGTWAR
jgi:hypothetical protein